MHFNPLPLDGAWLIEPAPFRDERGTFTRTFCTEEFGAHGLETSFPQHSVATSNAQHTLRGLHYQPEPHAEVKLVRCIAGAVWNVIVDMRPASPTYCRWLAFELTPENGLALYIPRGFAQGCMTLEPNSAVLYLISELYVPGHGAGIRYDDPALAIDWPFEPAVIADRDRNWPLIARAASALEPAQAST